MSDDKKQQVLTLGRLGWSLREIEEAVQVRRETASGYLKAAGVAVRAPRKRQLLAAPDRKGKVESGVNYGQQAIKGLRFETLEAAQQYLDGWESRWADTRIHGTTKRQVSAMFADERPHLLPLPVEPFRFYAYGERVVHLDGCVEVGAAYYHAPPGWIGRTMHVQWDGFRVRLLDKTNGTLQREYVVQKRGGRRVRDEDRPKQTPKSTVYLLGELSRAGDSVATLADLIRRKHGDEDCIRKLQGLRSLVKKYGAPGVDEAAPRCSSSGSTTTARCVATSSAARPTGANSSTHAC